MTTAVIFDSTKQRTAGVLYRPANGVKMYISEKQSHKLDGAVKGFEVALRSFVANVMVTAFPSAADFLVALNSVSIAPSLIYSKRFKAKLDNIIKNVSPIYGTLNECNNSIQTGAYDNDVPYVSEIIDLLLLFFNSHFSKQGLTKEFSSVEEFHYSCTLFHKIRNNLSHPASKPTTIPDAAKVANFVENVVIVLDNKFFWYASKERLREAIRDYKEVVDGTNVIHNLESATSTHANLLCREGEINDLYLSLLGSDLRQRLAGSVVLYGYGGVGKTAITTEFLYRLLRDKKDGKYHDLDYLLFFSSKDEYLRSSQSTGELYIDSARPEFSTFDELAQGICKHLKISNTDELAKKYRRGIIAIDNIENIDAAERDKIFVFVKSLPRNVQFIITSRNEEQCEEKIHIKEFKKDSIGISFVESIIDSEGFNVALTPTMIATLLEASKGNALIIVQTLNSLHNGVTTFSQIMQSLDSMRSKNSEMVASFMYKNTFDKALLYLSESGHPVNDVMCIISLYDERIELYSISRLAKVEVSDAEKICNYLLERLILAKFGEYYELNEFAKRFVLIKLLPDRFELSNLRDKIKNHKDRMKKKLEVLETTLESKSDLHKNVTEWQPRNYIDKIVIAELFSLYGEAGACVRKGDKSGFERYVREFNEHSLITNHPYVPLQKARLLKSGIWKFYKGDVNILDQVQRAYEEALESIEYDYRYLIGTAAHASLLMLLGVSLCADRRDYGRAIRFLEHAKSIFDQIATEKPWFICCNYLSISYKERYRQTNDRAYIVNLSRVVKQVNASRKKAPGASFDVDKYLEQFRGYLQ
ncbi:ATP-binding protein [Paraburkholderia sp. RL18-103-BIB-C]|uniref:ATP-binding protein n=1 Tax=Paraburkholderia sp. RL18-103-BIB-C TaxID=3031637 RepID=UPI0038B8B0E6